jgi:tetratricopeptide (TPR) repeat protein
MTVESPPRLKHDPALGPVIRAGDDAALAADRLVRNHDAVKARIAAPASRAWLWTVGLLMLALGGAVLVAGRLRGGSDVALSPVVAGAPATAPTAPTVPTVPTEVDAGAAVVIDATVEAALAPDPAPPPAPVVKPRRRPAAPPPADAVPAPAPAPSSDLPEQIRLYEAARTAGRQGEFATGIARIGELLGRFPGTPLRAEAELTRGELYARAGRHDEAVAALEQLIASPAHAGRRGELLRTLGDLARQRGDCARAVEVYTRARAERLSARERTRVASGLAGCTP